MRLNYPLFLITTSGSTNILLIKNLTKEHYFFFGYQLFQSTYIRLT
jgi:hypothetical protein